MRVDERASWSYGSRFKCPWHRNEPYVKLGALFTDVLLQQFAHSPWAAEARKIVELSP